MSKRTFKDALDSRLRGNDAVVLDSRLRDNDAVVLHSRLHGDDEAVVLDEARGVLRCAGREIALRPKTWQLLLHMTRNPGRVLKRQELVALLWPGVVVVDDSLNQCVVEIRRALGDRRDIVRTLPRLGYRFDAEPPGGLPVSTSLESAWEQLRTLSGAAEVAAARACFEREYRDGANDGRAQALTGIALSHVIDVLNRWSIAPQWQVNVAKEAAEQALALDPASALAHHARAHVAMLQGCHFEAWAGFRRTVELQPRLGHPYLRMAVLKLELGMADSAAPELTAARRCAASMPGLKSQVRFVEGMIALHLGDDARAARMLEESCRLNPQAMAHQWLASVNALRGREDEAAAHLAQFRRLTSPHTIGSLKASERSHNAVFMNQRSRFYEGLRRAGMAA